MFFSLTPRRSQALEALKAAVADAGGAVHYSLVAARMKISAWTAYDLLVELERLGLAGRRYAQSAGHPGRSRILFEPAAAALGPDPGNNNALAAAFERFSAISDEAAAARAYLATSSADLSYHFGFWLARLAAAGRHTQDAAVTILEGGSAPLAKIQTVAGMGLGTALSRLGGSRLAGRVTAAASAFTGRLDAGGEGLAEMVDAGRRLQLD